MANLFTNLFRRQTIIHKFEPQPQNLSRRSTGSALGYANKIMPTQTWRTHWTIPMWRNALIAAENTINPNRRLLLTLYKDLILDPQVASAIQSRKMKTLSKAYQLVDKEGNVNIEATELINTSWFRKYMELVLDSQYWGFSLIQFGDIFNDSFTSVEEVPRYNVRPEKGFEFVGEFPEASQGISWNDAPYNNWTQFVGEHDNLGLLNKAAPIVIWKRDAMTAWATYQEIFGMPMRVGKTNIKDTELLDNMKDMMQNMGRASWGVFDIEETIEFIIAGGKGGNTSKVFEDMIRLMDEQISKLIFGQTMTADDGSSKSQAEVHENVANDYAGSDQLFIEAETNTGLLPMLIRDGFKFTGLKFRFDNTENRTATEQIAIDSLLFPFYDVPEDYILEKYGTPVTKKPQPIINAQLDKPEAIKNYSDRLKKYYGGHKH